MNSEPAATPLPVESPSPIEAAAFLMTAAVGADSLPMAAALNQLRQRVIALRDPTAPESLDELSRHLPVLEVLWQRFAADALRAKHPDHRAKLLRAALQAQQAYSRTFALLRTLAMQKAGRTEVVLEEGGLSGDGRG